MFNIRFGKVRFGFWRVRFFKVLPLENFGMVSVRWTIYTYHVRIEIRNFIVFLHVLKFPEVQGMKQNV